MNMGEPTRYGGLPTGALAPAEQPLEKRAFLTPDQLANVDQTLYESGQGDTPRVVKFNTESGSQVCFIGTQHSSDPTHPGNARIVDEWGAFSRLDGPKLVLIEGGLSGARYRTIQEAAAAGEQSGIVEFLASPRERLLVHLGSGDIVLASPEPDRQVEHAFLLERFKTKPERVAAYYFARRLNQWLRSDFMVSPDLNAYLNDALVTNTTLVISGKKLSVNDYIASYEIVSHKKLSLKDVESIEALASPTRNEVSAACNQLRDELLMQAIETAVAEGSHVFAAYGSSHALTIEPELRKLAAK
jgi:hypothetical protein